MKESEYNHCRLCHRLCSVDRSKGKIGYCKMTDKIIIARAALHFWEEPIISGTQGSGTIFFSGCSLGCAFCQNVEISRGGKGKEIELSRLSQILFELMYKGAHNINFVTPTHYAPSIIEAVKIARSKGMNLPVVYNTGSYDTAETIKSLEDTVDIYLPDFKFYLPKTAKELSMAEDYPLVARECIKEMITQKPQPVIENGIMKSGVIVRILLLPGHVAEAKLTLGYLYKTYGDSIYISLMNQYTPMAGMKPPLDRKVTREEYNDLLEYADRLNLKNCFIQDLGSACEKFIPDFDFTGI